MSEMTDREIAQADEISDPPMTIAQQIRGTIALARLTLLVIRLLIAIIKLTQSYRTSASSTVPELPAFLGGDSGEPEQTIVGSPPVESETEIVSSAESPPQ